MAEAAGHRPDYERSDVDPRLLAILAAGLALFLIASPYILLALYPLAQQEPTFAVVEYPPEPRLQIEPTAEIDTLRAIADTRLSSYGWVDRQNGIVRLPLDRAMALTAERGLPGWTKP